MSNTLNKADYVIKIKEKRSTQRINSNSNSLSDAVPKKKANYTGLIEHG